MSLRRMPGLIFCLLLLCAWHAPAVGPGPGPAKGQSTGWPIPRFESLASNDVFLRAGPGFQYPILWDYHRYDLPVEVIGEFNVWRHVLTPDGTTGWVDEVLLHSLRSFIVTRQRHVLRAAPKSTAAPVAYLEKGVIGIIRSCSNLHCACLVYVNRPIDVAHGFSRPPNRATSPPQPAADAQSASIPSERALTDVQEGKRYRHKAPGPARGQHPTLHPHAGRVLGRMQSRHAPHSKAFRS